jgi:hypothetical protein
MCKEIELIKAKFFKIAKQIKAQPKNVFFYETKQDFGYPHIEYINETYCYVVTEKGEEIQRRFTKNPDELLFWLVTDLTRAEALEYELKHRDISEDFRRKYFLRHLELLAKIEPKWAEREKVVLNKILEEHPFTDYKQPHFL